MNETPLNEHMNRLIELGLKPPFLLHYSGGVKDYGMGGTWFIDVDASGNGFIRNNDWQQVEDYVKAYLQYQEEKNATILRD